MECERCGRSSTKENPVTKGHDPYQFEINDDDTEVWECEQCRDVSAGDI